MHYIDSVLCLQVTIVLRERLEALDPQVEVIVNTFEEGQGVEGLGEDPFVSCEFSEFLHSKIVKQVYQRRCGTRSCQAHTLDCYGSTIDAIFVLSHNLLSSILIILLIEC